MNDLLIMDENEVDFSPVDGWLQKYVFLFQINYGKKRKFFYNFANQEDGNSFTAPPMDIGDWISGRVWIPFERLVKTEHGVMNPKKKSETIMVEGVWGMATGESMPEYHNGVEVGVKMYWTRFDPLSKEYCKKYINQQFKLIQARKLQTRPRLSEYLGARNVNQETY